MLRKLCKFVGWSAAGIIVTVLVLYSIAIAINWRDRPPNAAALRFTAVYAERAPLADADNAYIYLLGSEAPADQDPTGVGSKRLAWMREGSPLDPRRDPLPDRKVQELPEQMRALRDACRPGAEDCAAAFATADGVLEEWQRSDELLLPRYRALIAHQGWREMAWVDTNMPIPSYSLSSHGQMLLMLQARASAQSGDAVRASELLEADLRYWRMVLANSDTLITKMTAAALIKRHFVLGYQALRKLPSAALDGACPASWRVPLSDAERSLLRTMAGEWLYISSNLRNLPEVADAEDTSLSERLGVRLVMPLYQPQDTSNRNADQFMAVVRASEVPWSHARASIDELHKLSTAAPAALPPSIYNLPGRWVMMIATPDYSSYVARVADIEGVRRAALLALLLRASATAPAEIAQAQSTAELRNPYDGKPFTWDAKRRGIGFAGAESGPRGRHVIEY